MCSVAVHWVYWARGFLDGAGKSQPPLMFCLGPPTSAIKQSEMAATCAGLEGSQVKPSYEPKLAAAISAVLEAT